MAGNGWRSYDVLQEELLADDSLIGSMIEFYRTFLFIFTYSHYGIYVGRPLDSNEQVAMIVHYFDPDEVREDRLERAALGKPCRINNPYDNRLRVFPNQHLHQSSIVYVARGAIGHQGYNIIFQYCESFATYCRYGLLLTMQALHPDTWTGWFKLKYNSYIVYTHPLIRSLANLETIWSSVSPWWLHSRVIRRYEISLIAYLRNEEFETYKCSLSALLLDFSRALAEEQQQPVPRDHQRNILDQAVLNGLPRWSMEGCRRLFVIILNESDRAEIWPNLEQLVIELFEIVFRESNRRLQVASDWLRNPTLLDFHEFKQQFYDTEALESDMLDNDFLPNPDLIETLNWMMDHD